MPKMFSRRNLLYLVLAVFLVTLPLYLSVYPTYIVNYVAVFGIVCISMNLLFGTAGQISIGHAGFMALGAYTTGLLMHAGVPFYVGIVAGGLVAAASGLLLGLPALRMTGFYLAIVTIAFGAAVVKLLQLWVSVTHGASGFYVPKPTIGDFVINNDQKLYYVILVFMVLIVIGVRNLGKSRTGRAFLAIRENELAAECMGVHKTKTKLIVFCTSAFIAGVGGGLYALLVGFLSPQSFTLMMSTYFLAAGILGGLGYAVGGALVGSVILFGLPEALRVARQWQTVAFGLAIILFILFAPKGMLGLLETGRDRISSLIKRKGSV